MSRYLLDTTPLSSYLLGRESAYTLILTLVTCDKHFQRVPGLSVMLLDRQQLRQ